MLTCAGAMSGYCSIGSEKSAPTPPSMTMIASTHAKIGRLMKRRDMRRYLLFASAPLPLDFPTRCGLRSEEHTSELQSLMRISYAVFCFKKKKQHNNTNVTCDMK